MAPGAFLKGEAHVVDWRVFAGDAVDD
jgi:hypothetical protein